MTIFFIYFKLFWAFFIFYLNPDSLHFSFFSCPFSSASIIISSRDNVKQRSPIRFSIPICTLLFEFPVLPGKETCYYHRLYYPGKVFIFLIKEILNAHFSRTISSHFSSCGMRTVLYRTSFLEMTDSLLRRHSACILLLKLKLSSSRLL